MPTFQKVILLLISLVFLCAGGLCSVVMAGASGLWPVFGVIMGLICLLSAGTWVVWLIKPDAQFLIKPVPLLVVAIAVVVLAYMLGFSDIMPIRFAG